ncbi:hypothetical protein MRX46_004737 [Escherichia coli]|nr:hypothetical protein [Escherichia coli]
MLKKTLNKSLLVIAATALIPLGAYANPNGAANDATRLGTVSTAQGTFEIKSTCDASIQITERASNFKPNSSEHILSEVRLTSPTGGCENAMGALYFTDLYDNEYGLAKTGNNDRMKVWFATDQGNGEYKAPGVGALTSGPSYEGTLAADGLWTTVSTDTTGAAPGQYTYNVGGVVWVP